MDFTSFSGALGGLLLAFGGLEAIKYIINRDSEKRKARAAAQDAELETMRRQYDWLAEKYEDMNIKLEALREELHELERKNIELMKRNNELEIALKVAEYNLCERPDDECIRRLPARQKCRLKKLLTGAYDDEENDLNEETKANKKEEKQ